MINIQTIMFCDNGPDGREMVTLQLLQQRGINFNKGDIINIVLNETVAESLKLVVVKTVHEVQCSNLDTTSTVETEWIGIRDYEKYLSLKTLLLNNHWILKDEWKDGKYV